MQCVKDMARVNRPLGCTVLVDDTPLAFLHHMFTSLSAPLPSYTFQYSV